MKKSSMRPKRTTGESGKKLLEKCRSSLSNQTNFAFSSSDFEEDPEGHRISAEIFEVKNAELCEQIEEDDFELVMLDEPEESSTENDDISTNTRPDSLNKTFT